jgi:hypothetical protein
MTRILTPSRPPLPTLLRWLAGIDLFVALGAFGGGAALIAQPDGSLIGLPLSALEHAPFDNYLIPGLLLCIVIGGSALVAGVAHLLRTRTSGQLSLFAGVVLVGWIVVQMLLLRDATWLQGVYLGIGILQVTLALRALGRAAVGPR